MTQAAATNAPHDIDILHQRQRAKSSDRVIVRPGDEQALVAVGKSQRSSSQRDTGFEQSWLPAGMIKPEGEAGSVEGMVHDMAADCTLPSLAQQSVGVKKQEPVTRRSRCACGQLNAAPARGLDDPRAKLGRNFRRAITGAAVGDDDLIRASNALNAGTEKVRRVKGRNDHRQRHAGTLT